jgi:Protein of unknown function (DUF1566)
LLALLLLAGAAVAQGNAAQQTCVAGASSLPSSRFQDNGDGTVTDAASKLMWMRCAVGQQWVGGRCAGDAQAYNWADAQHWADQTSQQGTAFFNDWRVPTLRDLATITDRACKNPRTNIAVFPGTPAEPFWSSTPRPGEKPEDRALALSFGADGVVLARKDERFHVRLVRTAF